MKIIRKLSITVLPVVGTLLNPTVLGVDALLEINQTGAAQLGRLGRINMQTNSCDGSATCP